MRDTEPKDAAVLADIISYEDIDEHQAKEMALNFLQMSATLPGPQKMFIEAFCNSIRRH